MSVFETQRSWAKRQRGHVDCRSLSPVSTPASRVDDFQDLVASIGCTESSSNYNIPSTEFRMNQAISTISTPPQEENLAITNKREVKSKEGNAESESGKNRDKKMKLSIEGSKITEQMEKSKQNSKDWVKKSDYVHVRARRGQATDSHSLAERARREKISERMKYLQNLVPGCNKIAGKAGMLDEIINYVQSLQQQVEFLSMKLATVNPRLDYIVDDVFSKQENLQVLPTIEISPQTPLINSASHFELCSTWGGDLQSLYSIEQGGPPLLSPSSFLSQQYSAIEDENETFIKIRNKYR